MTAVGVMAQPSPNLSFIGGGIHPCIVLLFSSSLIFKNSLLLSYDMIWCCICWDLSSPVFTLIGLYKLLFSYVVIR